MVRSFRRYSLSVIMCFTFSAIFSCSLLASDETPIVNSIKTYTFHTALETPIKEILDTRIQEVFRRLHLKAKLLHNPSSQRAMMLANEEGDGDAARVLNIKEIDLENTGNLIQVPESIITMELAVYSKTLDCPIDGWDSLKKYNNGARIGAKILEKNIPGKRTFLPTTEQLVQMLDTGRIDTMVEWNLIADHAIRNLKITDIRQMTPSLKMQPFYIYLHKKHQALVPKLSETIRQMKEEGLFDSGKKEFVFYTGARAPVKDILEKRLQEAFVRAGDFTFRLIYTGSAQRALVMANEEGDGDASRISDIKQIAPEDTENLLVIPEPVNDIRFYVYTNGPVFSIDGYKSLVGFHNGFRVGAKILEKNIPGVRTMLPDSTRLFQMLNAGRLDTVIEWDLISDDIIKQNNYSGCKKLTPPLVDLPTYCLIHKKHQSLIPKIVKAIQEMKHDGTFEKIEQEVLRELNLTE